MSGAKTSRYPSMPQMHSRVGWMYNFAFRHGPSGAMRISVASIVDRGQWLLELTILRLLGYAGRYRNRTRLADFNPIEQVRRPKVESF